MPQGVAAVPRGNVNVTNGGNNQYRLGDRGGSTRGDNTGTDWLVRLVRTADPVIRAGASDAEFTGGPGTRC